MQKVHREDVIEEYEKVAQKLGKTPTLSEFTEHGQYSNTVVYNNFESFEELKDVTGHETGEKRIADEKLLNDLRRVAEDYNRSPTVEFYDEYGEHNPKTLKRRWGNWNEVLETAGIDPTKHSAHWDDNTPVQFTKRYGAVELDCDYCEDTITRKPYSVERYELFFCGHDCKASYMEQQTGEDAWAWDGGKIEVECEWCADITEVKPSEMDNARFCTQECMVAWRSDYYSGENHPRKKDNPKYRYYGPNWDDQAAKCRKRDNYTCQICGKSNDESHEIWGEDLTAHHIIRFYDFDSYKVANQLANLITACKTCHAALEHNKIELPPDAAKRHAEWRKGIDL